MSVSAKQLLVYWQYLNAWYYESEPEYCDIIMHWASEFPAKSSQSVWQFRHTLLFYKFSQSIINLRSLYGYIAKWNMLYTLTQNMGNNFEIVQCTLLNKLISLSVLYFETVGQVVIMERILLLKNMGTEEGAAARCHCNNSCFIFLLVHFSLFLSFSLCSPFFFFSI